MPFEAGMLQRNIQIRLFLVCFPLFSLIFSTSLLVVSIRYCPLYCFAGMLIFVSSCCYIITCQAFLE